MHITWWHRFSAPTGLAGRARSSLLPGARAVRRARNRYMSFNDQLSGGCGSFPCSRCPAGGAVLAREGTVLGRPGDGPACALGAGTPQPGE